MSYCPLFKILSVTLVFRTFLGYALTYLNEIWQRASISTVTHQVQFLLRLTDFSMSYCPLFKILSVTLTSFPHFPRVCFDISEWNLKASFYIKSYTSSSILVMIDLLFHELLPFFENSLCHTSFPHFPRVCFDISEWNLTASFYIKSYTSSSVPVTIDRLFHELLPFVQSSLCHTSFPHFSWLCFHIFEWKLIASFYTKSYRSSSIPVTIDRLFHELLSH